MNSNKSSPKSPLCYRCKYRRDLVGDCHSQCAHPLTTSAEYEDPLSKLMSILGSRAPIMYEMMNHPDLQIKASAHGIKNGWFSWPFNFDPLWLEQCKGFEQQEELKEGKR